MNRLCPQCQTIVAETFNFCPNCSKALKDIPISITLEKQIRIYLLSAFLPPLGLWPAIKYLKNRDQGVKRVGLIALALTVISILVTLWIIMEIFSQLNSELQQYQNLGI